MRNTNLAFIARIPGHTGQLQPGTGSNIILGYGPWYAGTYNAVTVSLQKRFGPYLRFMNAAYTFTHATDDAVANLVTNEQVGYGISPPPDSTARWIVSWACRQSKLIQSQERAMQPAALVASNGNPVPQAGKFHNGPALTSGLPDLAPDHTFFCCIAFGFPLGTQCERYLPRPAYSSTAPLLLYPPMWMAMGF